MLAQFSVGPRMRHLKMRAVHASFTRRTFGGKALLSEFEYDIAFSFNAADEALATELNSLLSPRFATFLYSERQKELAGTDGQNTFSEVYGRSARIVVVLYRPEWGETKWTRVEQSAIKTRAFDYGWDFTTFVPTVPNPTFPAWFPKTRLYVGLERWGIEGAASVIEARATEQGSAPLVETAADRAIRYKTRLDLERNKKQFQNSEIGVKAALQAYSDFTDALKEVAATIKKTGTPVSYHESQIFRVLTGLHPASLVCQFRPHYANSLEGCHLMADFYNGIPSLPGLMRPFEKPRKLRTLRYRFELISAGVSAWVAADERSRVFMPSELADHLATIYMDMSEKL